MKKYATINEMTNNQYRVKFTNKLLSQKDTNDQFQIELKDWFINEGILTILGKVIEYRQIEDIYQNTFSIENGIRFCNKCTLDLIKKYKLKRDVDYIVEEGKLYCLFKYKKIHLKNKAIINKRFSNISCYNFSNFVTIEENTNV